MYVEQINQGDEYKVLNKCINISILDFVYLDEEDFFNTFHKIYKVEQRVENLENCMTIDYEQQNGFYYYPFNLIVNKMNENAKKLKLGGNLIYAII